MFRNVDKSRQDYAHYAIMALERAVLGMDALRSFFPDAKVDELNFVLFSTGGVHGTYNTIEEAEKVISGATKDSDDSSTEVTFLIVHPRLVALRYGTCDPQTIDDIDFLKRLRAASREVVMAIGMPERVDEAAERTTT